MSIRRPAETFHPGEFLREELDARGWSQSDFAAILDRPMRLVNEIVVGKRGISPEVARLLGAALGTSAELWMNLDASYQLGRLRGDDSDDVAIRARLYSKAPIREMVRRGWIESSENVAILEKRICSFLGVKTLDDQPTLAHAARKASPYDIITPSQGAWLARAKELARMTGAALWLPSNLKSLVKQLVGLLPDAESVRQVPELLGRAGIRFVVVEPLAGSKIDGACMWDDQVPTVALSLRFDRIDYFWFTLFHELGHVSDGKDALDIDQEGVFADSEISVSEKRADRFATENLLPEAKLGNFIDQTRPRYSSRQITEFAGTVQVHPGIVVGQLHHRKEVTYRNFRQMLVPVRRELVDAAVSDGWGSGPMRN